MLSMTCVVQVGQNRFAVSFHQNYPVTILRNVDDELFQVHNSYSLHILVDYNRGSCSR